MHAPYTWEAMKPTVVEDRIARFFHDRINPRLSLISSLERESSETSSRFLCIVRHLSCLFRVHKRWRGIIVTCGSPMVATGQRLFLNSVTTSSFHSIEMSYRPTSARRQQTSTNPITGEKIDYGRKTHFAHDQASPMYVHQTRWCSAVRDAWPFHLEFPR